MKANPLLISVVVLAALLGAVWFTKENPPSDEESDAVPLVEVAEDQIIEATIRRPDQDPLTVVRGDDGKWTFGGGLDIPADDAAIGFMATNLSGLEAERIVQEETTDWAPYGLGGEGEVSVEVRFAEGTGEAKKFVFGKSTPTGSSVYLRIDGDPRLMTTYSYVPASFKTTVFDWRDKSLLSVERRNLTRVEVQAEETVAIARKDADSPWRIVEPRELRADNFTADDLARAVADLEMTRVVEEGEAAANYGFDSPFARATAVDSNGEHIVTVARQSDGVYFARSSDLPGVYEVSATAAESLAVELSALRSKKLFDFGFDELSSIEARDGATSIRLERSDAGWTLASDEGRAIESEQAQTLIDRLRNLVATDFPAETGDLASYGLSAPAIEVAATESAEGAEAERVVISAPDSPPVYAARVGEPTVYEVEAPAVEELRTAIRAIVTSEAKSEE